MPRTKKRRDSAARLWHQVKSNATTGLFCMTNTIAIVLGLFILAAVGLDAMMYDWTNSVFLARKLTDLIEWIAFWR